MSEDLSRKNGTSWQYQMTCQSVEHNPQST